MANIRITGTADEVETLYRAVDDALGRLGIRRLTSGATAPDARGAQSITIVTSGELCVHRVKSAEGSGRSQD